MSTLVVTASFVFFLLAFTAIGVLSSRQKSETSEDYLVASRDVNPWLTALSAVSTNNSGYMFIGLIGFTWRSGLEAIWITLGWIAGDLLTWFWVHKRVRQQSEEVKAASVPALLAISKDGERSTLIAASAGLLTFFFLGTYAAAQLKAGSTTLHALFGWPVWMGAVIGVVVVVVYCFSGGIRASIWTDAAQSIVMMVAMALLLGACVSDIGGWDALMQKLSAIDPKLTEWMPRNLPLGFGLYLAGFIFAGVGTVGQPHILIRFMAIDSSDSVAKARNIYFVWYTLFSIAALAVGLYARVLLPDLTAGVEGAAAQAATEAALPTLAVKMLPSVLIGVMLAGIFSATMSTADSQLLSCSAALTQDVFPQYANSYRASKVATISIAVVALFIALTASDGVFALVLIAWSALASTLGPILLLRLAGRPLSGPLALVMMASGLVTVAIWGTTPYADGVFKALPGMVVPMVVYAGFMVFRRMRPESLPVLQDKPGQM